MKIPIPSASVAPAIVSAPRKSQDLTLTAISSKISVARPAQTPCAMAHRDISLATAQTTDIAVIAHLAHPRHGVCTRVGHHASQVPCRPLELAVSHGPRALLPCWLRRQLEPRSTT